MKKSTFRKIMSAAMGDLKRADSAGVMYTRDFMSGVIDRFAGHGFDQSGSGAGYKNGYYGPVDFENNIAQSVKNIRLWRGETTAGFASRFGVCKNTVERWEAGTNKPPKKTVRLLKKLHGQD